MESTIKAAVVHKTWIDGAREVLTDPIARCEYYDAVFDLYFSDQLKMLSDPVAQAIFVMVRPYIIADKKRYNDKCEKNRENALRRANASERKRTQANAENADHNNINTNINTNNNNNNNSLSLTSGEEREKERFDCLGIFFAHGACDVAGELQRFVDYYGALGWKTSKGAQIVSRRHAARQWEVKNTHKELAGYIAWYNAFAASSYLPPEIWTSINFIRQITDNKGAPVAEVNITQPDEFAQMIEQKCPKQLMQFVKQYKCTSLLWSFTQ